LVEVIGKFLFVVLLVTDAEFEFALLGPQHDGLAVHAADHIKGRLRFAAQGQLQEIFLDAGFDGLAQLRLNLEETVGRAQSFNALVGPLVIVVLDPELDAVAGRFEAVELRAHQELLPDGGPEALHFAEGHGMMRAGFEVGHPILFEFGLEAADAAPTGVLTPVVGEHFLGRLELAHRHPIDFDHRLGGRAAEQIRARDEARVIVEEGDEIGIPATKAEGEDIRLPHLIGRGPLEETGTRDIALLGFRSGRHQLRRLQPLTHRGRTGRQEKAAPQHLTDAFDPERGILLLEFDDLLGDGLWESRRPRPLRASLQPGFPAEAIGLYPVIQAAAADAHFLADQRHAKPFLLQEPDGLEFFLRRKPPEFFRAGPPRGASPLLLHYSLFIHVNTPLSLECQPLFP
jgi:hypothetical protein